MLERTIALFTVVARVLGDRLTELRREPDRGSHAVEFAIGIGIAAATALIVFGAYKAGVGAIIKTWVFQ